MKKVLALAALASASAASQAIVLYDAGGFEGFANGNISGQFGFATDLSTPAFNVVGSTGSKYVQANGGVSGGNWSYPSLNYVPGSNIVRITCDIARTVSTTASFGWYIDVYNTGNLSAFARTTRFGLGVSAGQVRAVVTSRFLSGQFNPAGAVTNVLVTNALTAGAFYRFVADLDYTTKKMKLTINGTDIAGGFAIPFADLNASDLGDADLYVSSTTGATDIGAFDNYKVEAVPEPASMAALGLGVAALIRRRKASK